MKHFTCVSLLCVLFNLCLGASAAERIFSEQLMGDVIPASLETWTGGFTATPEGLRPVDYNESLMFPVGMPEVNTCNASVVVTPLQEHKQAIWPMAGLTLYRDNGNNWLFTLTGSPEGKRYFQLIERHAGIHQAQSSTGSLLPVLTEMDKGDWQLNRTYKLTLKLSSTRITGLATDLQTGEIVFERSFDLSSETPAIRSGLLGIYSKGLDATYTDFTLEGLASDRPVKPGSFNRDLVTILDQPQARPFIAQLVKLLQARGIHPTYLSPEALKDRRAITRTGAGTVILPWAPGYPTAGTEALTTFLRSGGSMLAVGGNLSTDALKEEEAILKVREEALAKTKATGQIFDGSKIKAEDFTVGKYTKDGDVITSLEPDETAGYALNVKMPQFSNWVNITTSIKPLPEDKLLTLFWARGGANTRNMIMEYAEEDGSRWIATINLTPEWKRYALLPRHFIYWPDNPSKDRGFAGDCVKLTHISRFSVGLSSIGCNIPAGSHEFSIGGFEFAPINDDLPAINWTPPVIECLSPDYKVYTAENVNNFTVTSAEHRTFKLTANLPRIDVVSPVSRSKGEGFYSTVQRRWIPLVEGRSQDGGEATLVSLFFPQAGFLGNARWAVLGVAKREDLITHTDAFAELADTTLQRLSSPIRLKYGGLNQACLIRNAKGELEGFDARPEIGFEIVNEGLGNARTEVQIIAVDESDRQYELGIFRQKVEPGIAEKILMSELDKLSKLPAGFYKLNLDLRIQGVVADRIIQDFSIINSPSATRDEMVQTRDGQFVLAGQRWYAHGINYWPRYVSGSDPDEYWGHWLTPQFYMPDEIDEDLRIAHDMGLNVLAVHIGDVKQAAPLNDFLARCAKHGIKTYISVGGLHPFTGDIQLASRLINAAQLQQNPAVFAYDLAWEPHWGNYSDRIAHRTQWERWVIQQYGSMEAAEKQWNFAMPRTEDGLTDVPSDAQIRTDGDWRIMACAYSRFLDDYLGRAWMQEAAAVRLVDPNHLVSFRAAGQPSWQHWGAYDMIAAGPFMDFLGPEGYGLDPKEAGFTTCYAKWAANGKPVWWAEFGASISRYPTPELVETQKQLWQGFCQMVLDSEANGDAGWWFPGGFRVNENSDFGVISQQGTLRPAAQVRKSFTKRFEAGQTRKQRETVVIDRDAQATNYYGVYETWKQAWVDANARGRGLDVTTEATGTTSATVPLKGIGNTEFEITGPPKYLTGLFRSLEIRTGEGDWTQVRDGNFLKVPAGQPIYVRASVVNTGEPQWLASTETGSVVLAAGQRDGLSFEAPLTGNVARYETGNINETLLTPGLIEDTTVTFGFYSLGRAWFGERVTIKLELLR